MNIKKLRSASILLAVASLSVCAVASAEPAVATSITNSSSLNNSGYERMKARDYVGAKPYFEQALTVEPSLAIAHLNLGAVYQNTGNPAEAKSEYRLAIANDRPSYGFPPVTRTTDGNVASVSDIANRNLDVMSRTAANLR